LVERFSAAVQSLSWVGEPAIIDFAALFDFAQRA
jgi:hypothetical protein